MKNLVIIVPCYNEEANIGVVVEDVYNNIKTIKQEITGNIDIVIVDDGSKDKSIEIIKEKRKKYNNSDLNIIILKNPKNLGLGKTVNNGLEYFIKNYTELDKAIVLDGDASHKAEYMTKLIKASKNTDIVICSRFRKGSVVQGVPPHRQFLSIGAGAYNKLFLPMKNVRDYTCGYRIYSYDIIKKIKEKYNVIIDTSGFSCMVELLYKANQLRSSINEIPFILRYDEKIGESKMNVTSTIKDSLALPVRLKKYINNYR